jgi:lipoprotein-anchoring transpeptidase ErfK/SrfK
MAADRRQIVVDLDAQSLTLLVGDNPVVTWPVSTAANGPGERQDSGCTPRGRLRVRLKIGDGCAPGTVFVGRRPTGECYDPAVAAAEPGRDWILTRILWLTGCEPGRNRGGDCDTLRRFIYIHGCPDDEPMGVARSHGCIRMRNADVIELFERVDNGCPVQIVEAGDNG